VSRRRRALGFGTAALLAAAVAAAVADGYGERVASGYGELRPVVVAKVDLRAGDSIGPVLDEQLELRRVPARFVPTGTLVAPMQALGLEPTATVPAGSYLLAAQLRPPRRPERETSVGAGRRPVEILVSGADALLAAGADPEGSRVDVVVTTEPTSGAGGRTYVAAAAVPLLALAQTGEAEGPGAPAAATLGLTRKQALRLIAAENFARQVTVLPAG
jgi:Flp pilus assembly protein CpaB